MVRTLKNLITTCVIAFGCIVVVRAHYVKELPCLQPEYAQMDFWIGTWDLRWGSGDDVKGRNVVARVLDDCIIEENFSGYGEHPLRGKSLSTFDKSLGLWRQTWVDNTGTMLDFTGGPVDDVFIFSRTSQVGDREIQQRMTFYNISDDAFDWDWEVSNDKGLTWKLKWRIHYSRVEDE